MKKRLLVLLMLIGFLVVLMPGQGARAACECDANFAACMQEAGLNDEECQYAAWSEFQTCLNSGTYSVCYPTYEAASYLCDIAYNGAENACDSTYSQCLIGCGGSGQGGGSTYCNDDEQMGYLTSGSAYADELYSNCVANGDSAFGEGGLVAEYFDTCMSNTGGNNQGACCHDAVKYALDLNYACHLDYRRSDCRHCID